MIYKETMEEYMKFRHFVRHIYGFQLEWERMEGLINGINDFWKIIKENINNFLLENNELLPLHITNGNSSPP